MVRRTKEEAQATRNLLLDTAERLFHERGVSRTSLNDIAQAAGVTRGAIYWHFQDKAELFHEMMRRVTLPMEEAARRLDVPVDDPIGLIRSNVLDALRLISSDPQVRRVFEIARHKAEFVDEMQGARERKMKAREEWLRSVERGFTLAVRLGHIERRLPPRTTALGLNALIDGLIQCWMLDPEAFDLVKTGAQLLDTYLAGAGVVMSGKG